MNEPLPASFIRSRAVALVEPSRTQVAGEHGGVDDVGIALLRKPITPGALQRRVREVLDDEGRVTDVEAAGGL
jgi:hypothetical protein